MLIKSVIPRLFWSKYGPCGCRGFHIKRNSKQQIKPASFEVVDDKRDACGEVDDASYFKKLGKTVNPYWIKNGKKIFQQIDWKRLLDEEKRGELEENFRRRVAEVDLDKIRKLWGKWEGCGDEREKRLIEDELVRQALWIPNDSHPAAVAIEGEVPKEVFRFGEPLKGDVLESSKFCNKYGYLRNEQLGNLNYSKSYYLKGPLAELEEALVRYSLHSLIPHNFQIVSVSDILYPHVIESCGMPTRGERDQVFWVHSHHSSEQAVLSGTAEMSIGGSLQDAVFEEDQLPIKFTSVSRCYRAETSNFEEERGLYRVHEFTKVEMFGITANETGEESNELHELFRNIEETNFANLNIHFKTLEMPPTELALSAYRKWDMEAWMPGRKMFGEISSCSNCTDFQSRRLNIRYRPKNGQDLKFVHTVNGTACAVPRLLITLVETFQKPDGIVELPDALKPFMARSWEASVHDFRRHKIQFLRTRAQQEKHVHSFFGK